MHPALRDIQAQVSIDLVFSGPQADVQGFFLEMSAFDDMFVSQFVVGRKRTGSI